MPDEGKFSTTVSDEEAAVLQELQNDLLFPNQLITKKTNYMLGKWCLLFVAELYKSGELVELLDLDEEDEDDKKPAEVVKDG